MNWISIEHEYPGGCLSAMSQINNYGKDMTDKFKGVLVTFEKDIREDDAEKILSTLEMIKGVLKVKPYVSNLEDYMLYERGYLNFRSKMIKAIMTDLDNPKGDK